MKRYIKSSEAIFGMANLNPKKSGLPVIIWSDHSGVSRKIRHNEPRVKIGKNDHWAEISISDKPKILSHSSDIKKSEMDDIQKGIEYVARNYDIFLKHFYDTDYEFDDEALFNALRERGEYR